MDLMDLYRAAKVHDARHAAARAQFRVMQEAVPQARAGAAPNFSSDVAVKRYQYDGMAGCPNYSFGRRHRYRSEPPRPADR